MIEFYTLDPIEEEEELYTLDPVGETFSLDTPSHWDIQTEDIRPLDITFDAWQRNLGHGMELVPGAQDWAKELQDQPLLDQYRPQYEGNLFDTKDKFGWIGEKTQENAFQTVFPYLGMLASGLTAAAPVPGARPLAALIFTSTGASNLLANWGDVNSDYKERKQELLGTSELDSSDKNIIRLTGTAVNALDYIGPTRLTKGALKKQVVDLALSNREAFLKMGVPDILKAVGIESLTEGGQKSVSMAAADISLGSMRSPQEYMEESVSEAAVAGPSATTVIAPTVGAQYLPETKRGRQKRERGEAQVVEAQRLVDRQAQIAGDEVELETPEYIDRHTELFDTFRPETNIPEVDPNRFIPESVRDVGKALGETFAFKPISLFVDEERRFTDLLKTNLSKDDRIRAQNVTELLRAIKQANLSPESFTGEARINIPKELSGTGFDIDIMDFKGRQQIYNTRLFKEWNEVLPQISYQIPFMGQMGTNIHQDVNEYLFNKRHGLEEEAEAILNNMTEQKRKVAEKADAILKSSLFRAYKLATGAKTPKMRLSMGQHKNYMPLTMDISFLKTVEGKEAFKRLHRKKKSKTGELVNANLTDADLNALYDDVIANDGVMFTDQPLSERQRRLRGISENKKGWERHRKFNWRDIKDDPDAQKLFEQSVPKLVEKYMYSVAKRVAGAHTFGKDGSIYEKWLKNLQKNAQPLGGIREDVIERAYDLYDANMGFYKPIKHPAVNTLNKAITTAMAAGHLGLATISSLSEVAWIIQRHGFTGFIRGLPLAASYAGHGLLRTIHKDLPGALGLQAQGRGKEVLVNVGYGLHSAVNERMQNMFGGDFSKGLDRWFRSPAGAFLTHWTNFNRVWAAGAGLKMMESWAKDLKADPNYMTSDAPNITGIKTRLMELGIQPDILVSIYEMSGNKISLVDEIHQGRDKPVELGRLSVPWAGTLPNGDPKEIRHIIAPAIQTMIDDVVINPKVTNRPLWMSDPHMAIFSQLKSFPIVFGNTVMKQATRNLSMKQVGCQHKAQAFLNTVFAIGVAYGIATMANMIKDELRGKEYGDDKDDLLPQELQNLQLAGVFGAFDMVLSIFNGGRYGDPWSGIAGPTAGTVGRLISDVTEKDPIEAVTETVEGLLAMAAGPIGVGLKEDK